jgi:3-deoxy-D-manno-octulosonic-acid transferase
MADTGAGMIIRAYELAGLAALPFLPLALSIRASRGKEDHARIGERYGRASAPRPPGRLVWVHAASVGETNTVLPLIERLDAAGFSVVLTSVTTASAATAAARLPRGALHQFAPIDVGPLIGRFLDHWRPNLALFVESEVWPATIRRLAAGRIPQVLVNARLSDRSFRRWQRLGSVAGALFSSFALCLAQSDRDGERYAALGAKVHVVGNLKFDVPPPSADGAALSAFREAVAGRPSWLAASTHEGEEAVIGEAHRLLRQRFPDILTTIVPRHPNRAAAIRDRLAADGLNIARRSIGEPIGPATDIYLADTLGELGLFYRAAPVAFIGGSLVPRGGQNPIEPARLEAVVLHGPHVHNFADIYAALDRSGEFGPVAGARSLADAVGRLLADPALARRSAHQAAAVLPRFGGALDATMTALGPFLAAGAEAA